MQTDTLRQSFLQQTRGEGYAALTPHDAGEAPRRLLSRGPSRARAKIRAKTRANARGLTLVELIIVITIIGALMGVIAFAIFQRKAAADKGVASLACKQWAQQLLTYRQNHTEDDCPSIDTLKTDLNDKTANTKDPWGQPYIVKCDEQGNQYILSKGPDKKEGTPDDIRSDQSAGGT